MVVKAENGKTRTYKLSIVRSGGSTSSTTEKKTEKTTQKSTEKTTEKSTQKTDQSVHKGDLSGDGKINALDIIFIQRLIVGLDKVTDTKKAIQDILKKYEREKLEKRRDELIRETSIEQNKDIKKKLGEELNEIILRLVKIK